MSLFVRVCHGGFESVLLSAPNNELCFSLSVCRGTQSRQFFYGSCRFVTSSRSLSWIEKNRRPDHVLRGRVTFIIQWRETSGRFLLWRAGACFSRCLQSPRTGLLSSVDSFGWTKSRRRCLHLRQPTLCADTSSAVLRRSWMTFCVLSPPCGAYSKRVPRANCALRIKKCAPRISSGIYF